MPRIHALNAAAKRKKDFEDRMAKQKKVFPSSGSPEAAAREGAMQKAAHLAGLTPEGVAGEILTIWLVNALMLLFQTQYHVQERQFKNAQDNDIAYMQKRSGKWPKIYPLGEDGLPDFDAKPNTDGTASAEEVIANGYVPPPDMNRAIAEQWKLYESQMWGTSHKSGRDLASDMAARNMAMPRPKG